ncbi:GAF domain-containing sensor histidine kinase [Actinopolymorpha pittospori]|uniref:Signal transduction histidine kinase n=1 Tax=Actinopolymorpha pittospori TaxID=648752 RepID=A0A927R7Z8_9ACTN|nr:GAF domain-containing protein [Actinopolymorpha pittospori]MBE1604789.1 signal transduction histidine kinase [Actinopolymorpha pittospori]
MAGEERHRQQWLESALETNRLLLEGVSPYDVLRTVTEHIHVVSGAEFAAIVTVNAAYPEETAVYEAAEGLGLGHMDGSPVPLQGLLATVVESGTGVVSEDITQELGWDPAPQVAEALSVLGPGVLLPLAVGGKVLGVLIVGWRRGSPNARISEQEVQMMKMCAGLAALALQQVDARLLLAEERDRIANYLRDVVIDRLFSIVTYLHSVAGLVRRQEVQLKVDKAIDELDETTQQIRSAIFALPQERAAGGQTPSAQVLDEIDWARAILGFTPSLVIHGPVDQRLSRDLQRELARAVREALANAAAHSAPSMVEVVVRVSAGQLTLTVTDDGRLSEQAMPHSALPQLRNRALRLGGSCTVRANDQANTIVEWRVPLTA